MDRRGGADALALPMPRPLLLFAPGAGAGTDHPWMRAWAARLAPLGIVVPFDYDYRREGRKPPDRLPKLIAAHVRALDAARDAHPGHPIVLVGKSMGGRVGLHLTTASPVAAAICLGYPLIGANGAVRDAALRDTPTPVLLVQGTRDPMAPLDRLRALVATRAAPTLLHVVDGGDHGLRVGGRDPAPRQATSDAGVVAAIADALTSWGLRG